jgi:hypothetical protein
MGCEKFMVKIMILKHKLAYCFISKRKIKTHSHIEKVEYLTNVFFAIPLYAISVNFY